MKTRISHETEPPPGSSAARRHLIKLTDACVLCDARCEQLEEDDLISPALPAFRPMAHVLFRGLLNSASLATRARGDSRLSRR